MIYNEKQNVNILNELEWEPSQCLCLSLYVIIAKKWVVLELQGQIVRFTELDSQLLGPQVFCAAVAFNLT